MRTGATWRSWGIYTAIFSHIVLARQRAEDVAAKTRVNRILGRLANSKARQPLRNYDVGALVKIWRWRKVLPREIHAGPRGGLKKASRPGWVGPGRVIFSERLARQDLDDDRRHIIWVLMGGKLLGCSAHSVRPVTPTVRGFTTSSTTRRTSPNGSHSLTSSQPGNSPISLMRFHLLTNLKKHCYHHYLMVLL